MKRLLADWTGNYGFFVPLVLLVGQAWTWPTEAITNYLLGSILIAGIGGRAYMLFVKYVWYPLWKIEF